MLNVSNVASCSLRVLHEEQEHRCVVLLVLAPLVDEIDLGRGDTSDGLNEPRPLTEAFEAEGVEVIFSFYPLVNIHGLSAVL